MKLLYLVLLFVLPAVAVAQANVKIYAYSQETTPGNIPTGGRDENGREINTKPKASVSYYFYAAYPSSVSISFGGVWINGKYYQVQTEKVLSTPVVNVNNDIPDNPVKTTLVPATKLRVTSIIPTGGPQDYLLKASWFRKMISHSELIITYFYKGKKYFIPVKKIKVLPPVAGI